MLALLGTLILAGIVAYRDLPVEAYPDVTNVSVQVITLFPGHAAEEVERLVTIPIESVMNGIPGRVSMRSISLFGLSQITLVFEDNADNNTIRNLAHQLLGDVTLPPGANAKSPSRRDPDRGNLPLHAPRAQGISRNGGPRA